MLPGLLERRKPNPQKPEAYECGVEPTSDVSGRFPVRFYLIAMLFVIFDVEAASFYPWAVQMHALAAFRTDRDGRLFVVLAIGYAYVWRNGGFHGGDAMSPGPGQFLLAKLDDVARWAQVRRSGR